MNCRRVFSWIANILFWGAIALTIVAYAGGFDDMQSLSLILCVIFGIIYYIETFLCSYCSYLCGVTSTSGTYEDIDKMFKASPSIRMNIECYHTKHSGGGGGRGGGGGGGRGGNAGNAGRGGKGGGRSGGSTSSTNSTRSTRVVTHRASEEFSYKSWRDVSGEFKLDTSSATKDESVAYVLLSLSLEVQFAADGSGEDYNMAKSDFMRRNRFDVSQSFTQTNTIPHFRKDILVQVTDQPPCCVGVGFFMLFGLLTLNAIYSTYLDSCCHRQKFSIKKVVSTRQDLNAPQMQTQYAYYDPRMIIGAQMVVFDPFQAPQMYALNQPAAQQYIEMQMVQPQVLFAPLPQAQEIIEIPQNETQSMLDANQSIIGLHQSHPPQNAHPQYGMPQGQYPPPQHLASAHPQVNY